METWHKEVWHPTRIPRHSSFLWLVLKGKAKTQEWIQTYHKVRMASKCIMCGKHVEDSNHLFVSCTFATQLRHTMYDHLGIPPLSTEHLVNITLRAPSLPQDLRLPYRLYWAGIVYHIWRERNLRLFQGDHKDRSMTNLWSQLKTWVEVMLHVHHPKVRTK